MTIHWIDLEFTLRKNLLSLGDLFCYVSGENLERLWKEDLVEWGLEKEFLVQYTCVHQHHFQEPT